MWKAYVFLASIFFISGCASQTLSPTFAPGREVISHPYVIEVAEHKNNFKLAYGNDPSLEQAFNQYARTGKAPNIVTDGFVRYAYNSGQQPIITTATFQETVISLQAGERFTNISSGDPNRWSYTVAVSGMGNKQQQNVLVKPSMVGIATNMVITTDRRIYNLKLISAHSSKAIKNISFWYPEELLNVINTAAMKQADDSKVATLPDVSLSQLNFNYSVTCGTFCRLPSWAPTRVLDDGTHTYIQFPANIANRDMPALFIVNGRAKELVNYRSKPPYFVVDKIFKEAVLLIGVGQSQTAITVTNHCFE